MESIRQGDIPGVQLRRRLEIRGRTPEELWPYLVDPQRMAGWIAERVTVESGPPMVFHLERTSRGAPVREQAEVLTIEEPARLVVGLRLLDGAGNPATMVTFELARSDDGSEAGVFQEGFQALPLSSCLTAWEHSRTRWTEALERLADAATLTC